MDTILNFFLKYGAEILTNIAFILFFYGSHLIEKKKSKGWMMLVIGELMTLGVGLLANIISMVVWAAIFTLKFLWAWRQWVKDPNLP